MNELDLIYRYACAQAEAETIGLSIGVSRTHYVVRFAAQETVFAEVTTIAEVEKALEIRRAVLDAPNSARAAAILDAAMPVLRPRFFGQPPASEAGKGATGTGKRQD